MLPFIGGRQQALVRVNSRALSVVIVKDPCQISLILLLSGVIYEHDKILTRNIRDEGCLDL